MSLAPSLGAERNLLEETPEHAHQLRARPADPAQPRARDAARRSTHEVFKPHTIDMTWPVAEGARRHGGGARAALRDGARRDRRRRQHPHPLRPRARPRPRADPVAAGGRRRPPPPRARGHAPARRDRRRDRRGARGPPLRDADRLRRQRDQPVPDVRDARRAGGRRTDRASRERRRDDRAHAEDAAQNLVKAIGKGLLKTISKMGISTIQSYRGAQIFEAVGLERELIDRLLHAAPPRGSAGSASRCWPRRRWTRHARAYRHAAGPIACCRSAASTPGAATASTTCGTRTRSRCCSTRSAARRRRAPERLRRVRAAGQRGRHAQGDAARAARGRAGDGARRRSRSRRSSRRRRSSSASPPAR